MDEDELVAMKIPLSGCITIVSDSVLLYFISSSTDECGSLIAERSDHQIQRRVQQPPNLRVLAYLPSREKGKQRTIELELRLRTLFA